MKTSRIQTPSESRGARGGTGPTREAHREHSEHGNFRRNCVRLKEVFGV